MAISYHPLITHTQKTSYHRFTRIKFKLLLANFRNTLQYTLPWRLTLLTRLKVRAGAKPPNLTRKLRIIASIACNNSIPVGHRKGSTYMGEKALAMPLSLSLFLSPRFGISITTRTANETRPGNQLPFGPGASPGMSATNKTP